MFASALNIDTGNLTLDLRVPHHKILATAILVDRCLKVSPKLFGEWEVDKGVGKCRPCDLKRHGTLPEHYTFRASMRAVTWGAWKGTQMFTMLELCARSVATLVQCHRHELASCSTAGTRHVVRRHQRLPPCQQGPPACNVQV